ncbi:unnamed protein product [Boreogadus saida]
MPGPDGGTPRPHKNALRNERLASIGSALNNASGTSAGDVFNPGGSGIKSVLTFELSKVSVLHRVYKNVD